MSEKMCTFAAGKQDKIHPIRKATTKAIAAIMIM